MPTTKDDHDDDEPQNQPKYYFEEISLDTATVITTENKPFFEEQYVEATYILYLDISGNPTSQERGKNIEEQLRKFPRPTKRIYLVHNYGRRRTGSETCHHHTPTEDLIRSNLEIFRHAAEKGIGGNILILEDDFFWSPYKSLQSIRRSIEEDIGPWLMEMKDRDFIYKLGCIPLLSFLNKQNHYFTSSVAMHAVIYSKLCRDNILASASASASAHAHAGITLMVDWDQYFLIHHLSRNYMYKEPLVYQTFPETENRKNWGNGLSWSLSRGFVRCFLNLCIRLFSLDAKIDPGYRFFYLFSKMCGWLIYLGIFLLVMLCSWMIWLSMNLVPLPIGTDS